MIQVNLYKILILELFMMASILDSYGGITNITKSINVIEILDLNFLLNIPVILNQLKDNTIEISLNHK